MTQPDRLISQYMAGADHLAAFVHAHITHDHPSADQAWDDAWRVFDGDLFALLYVLTGQACALAKADHAATCPHGTDTDACGYLFQLTDDHGHPVDIDTAPPHSRLVARWLTACFNRDTPTADALYQAIPRDTPEPMHRFVHTVIDIAIHLTRHHLNRTR